MLDQSAQTLRRLYVLDDEPGIRAFVCHVAAREGFAVAGFAATAPLFDALARERPEILVLDLSLGESDAVEVMQRLEALDYRGKVLLISGRHAATLRDIKQIGANRGLAMLPPLPKPFRADALKARLNAEPEVGAVVPGVPREAPLVSVSLAEALEKHWVTLWYQLKIALASRTVCGAEALVRVAHPLHGILSPAAFLPPSGSPFYQPLSALVLRQACKDWLSFAAAGHPLKLAVNIPVSVISAPGFVTLVRDSLPKHPDFPGLVIEVTEDEAVRDADLVKQIGAQLRLYDVSLSVDDFGSAYSSFSRLLDLPFAEVKLDRSFASGCAGDPLKAALCQTVVDLAHRFGALVCAEGVETAQDVALLASLGCDSVQGYFFARPMPAPALLGHIRAFSSAPAEGSVGGADRRVALR